MNVFDLIPADFFRPLTGRNQAIYVESLLVIHRAFKQTFHIDRDALLVQLVDRFSELDLMLDLEAEQDPACEPIAPGHGSASSSATASSFATVASSSSAQPDDIRTFSGMAHAVLRRLAATGWIELETKPQSFDYQVTLPPYAIDMLKFLDAVTQQDTQAYKNHAFATYSALRTILDPESHEYLFTAFSSAYENCQQLMDALKLLLNNIKRFHRLLGDYVRSNDILKGHFEEYQTLVNERIFHPMVTRDSVLRFRQPVIALVAQISDDEPLLQAMASQAVQEKHHADIATAIGAILPQLQEIADTFDGIDAIMLEIQNKNHAYTKASTDKLIYLLNQDRSIKGQLVGLIMNYRRLPPAAHKALGESIALFRQAFVDSQSVFARTSRRIRSNEPPVPVQAVAQSDDDLHDFLRSTGNRYSHERVLSFVRDCLGDRAVVDSADIPVENVDQFVLLLLAVLKAGDRRLFYSVEFLDGVVETSAYRYPRLRFMRRDHAAESAESTESAEPTVSGAAAAAAAALRRERVAARKDAAL